MSVKVDKGDFYLKRCQQSVHWNVRSKTLKTGPPARKCDMRAEGRGIGDRDGIDEHDQDDGLPAGKHAFCFCFTSPGIFC